MPEMGARVTLAGPESERWIAERARAEATKIAEALRFAALQEVLAWLAEPTPPADVSGQILGVLTARAHGLLRSLADDHAGTAMGLGRHDEAAFFRDDIAECVYTPLLGANACEACADADGTVVAFGSPEYERLRPPYAECDGMSRCRCQFVFTLRTEAGGPPPPVVIRSRR